MKKYNESMREHADRLRDEGHRKPLRNFQELCKELQVDPKSMSGYMGTLNGPKPKINGRNFVTKNTWYDPDEFRARWKVAKAKLEAPGYKKYQIGRAHV